MISSREEFLLLLQNWTNASAQVTVVIAFGGEQSADPLATAFLLKLSARSVLVNEDTSNVAFSVGDDRLLSFGFDGATFRFRTSTEMPPMLSSLQGLSQEVEESFTVGLKSGLIVTFLKFN
jgi:hypothetical protein